MSGQKGSLKDRLRSWYLFLNYKLKLRKKQKEEKRRLKIQKKQIQIQATGKYYSKPKVFGLTILGLFFGALEPKSRKEIKTLEKRMESLEIKISSGNIDESVLEEIKIIEKDIILSKNDTKFNKVNINKYEEKLNNIKQKINTSNKEVELLSESTKVNVQNKDNSLNDNLRNETLSSKNQNFNKSSKKGIYTPTLEIKVFNSDLKKYNKSLKEIKNKIKQNESYNNLYEYEFLLKQLRLRLNELLNKYENLKEMPGFNNLENINGIKDFDEFSLRKDSKKIKETMSLCENTLLLIENQRKELLSKETPKQELKKEEKKPITKEEKKKEKKVEDKEKNKLMELVLADKIIYDSIAQEKRKIARFNRQVATLSIKRRKHSIFYYTKNLVSSIVNFSFSLFPLSLFQNKILGGLASGIMINNSLRSIRKILNPELEISYIYTNIEKEIASASNYLNRMFYVCDDSLQQIEDIRATIYKNYGNDIIYSEAMVPYLADLSKIELKIREEQATILNMNQDLQIIRAENKQKVKKIENYY